MKTKDQQTSPVNPSELLVNYVIANPTKGTTLKHSEIESIMGVPYHKDCGCINGSYAYYVTKANKKLTQLSLRLEIISGYGYRILQDNRYVDVMTRMYNTGVKYIENARVIANSTDTSMLNPQEMREWKKSFDKISDACSHLNRIETYKPVQIP